MVCHGATNKWKYKHKCMANHIADQICCNALFVFTKTTYLLQMTSIVAMNKLISCVLLLWCLYICNKFASVFIMYKVKGLVKQNINNFLNNI